MIRSFLVLFTVLFAFRSAVAHPIKMTTSRLTYDKKQSRFTVTINFFEDDFKAHLEKMYHKRDLNFGSASDLERVMVAAYVNKKMIIKVNKIVCLLNLQDLKRGENNVVQGRFLINIPKGKPVKLLEITDALLFEAFPEQVNILHLDFQNDEGPVLQFMPSQAYKALNVNL